MADENEKSFHSVQPDTEEIDTESTPTDIESPVAFSTPATVAFSTPPSTDETPISPTSTASSNYESMPLSTGSTTNSANELEILGEQFENYLRISQALLKTLKRPKDIEICTNLLRKVQRLNDSRQADVKRNNNMFFRYCLRVLKWTSDHQPLDLYQCLYRNMDTDETVTESRTWLEDKKSYMSSKYLKDGTTIIYTAIANDPSAGWQDGGLNILAKRGAAPRK